MANTAQLNEILKMRIDWVKDPVPPWLIPFLDKAVLKELTLASLQHAKAVQEANSAYIDRAIATVNKAKF
jgi:hypothetical protein